MSAMVINAPSPIVMVVMVVIRSHRGGILVARGMDSRYDPTGRMTNENEGRDDRDATMEPRSVNGTPVDNFRDIFIDRERSNEMGPDKYRICVPDTSSRFLSRARSSERLLYEVHKSAYVFFVRAFTSGVAKPCTASRVSILSRFNGNLPSCGSASTCGHTRASSTTLLRDLVQLQADGRPGATFVPRGRLRAPTYEAKAARHVFAIDIVPERGREEEARQGIPLPHRG